MHSWLTALNNAAAAAAVVALEVQAGRTVEIVATAVEIAHRPGQKSRGPVVDTIPNPGH
jgi:hypothetical protein